MVKLRSLKIGMSEVAGQGSSRRGGDPRPRFAAGTSFTDSFLNAAAEAAKAADFSSHSGRRNVRPPTLIFFVLQIVHMVDIWS